MRVLSFSCKINQTAIQFQPKQIQYECWLNMASLHIASHANVIVAFERAGFPILTSQRVQNLHFAQATAQNRR
ncbi:MAG: hypothetical protein COA85_12775 [Robiginitomaculum sp.]|nr:MAG: hypothetical protein COA85_12775 [Robiginitomaculum sp.]